MRYVALREAPARPFRRLDAPEVTVPTLQPELQAGVCERNAAGLPSRIALPAPLAGPRVSLYADRRWIADVLPDGTVESDAARQDALRAIVPGTKIVAASDRQGRVLALCAWVRLPEGAGVTHTRERTAETTETRQFSSWRPGSQGRKANGSEVFIAGAGGKVLAVR